jgi:hypothetical protein
MELVMLKCSSLITGLSIAFLPFLSNVLPAVAVDRSSSQSLSGSAIADDNLVCYMNTTDGRTLNLNRLCGSNISGSNGNGSYGNSSNGSNSMGTSTVVNAEPVGNLGGLAVDRTPSASACYGLDAQGLPCPPVQ